MPILLAIIVFFNFACSTSNTKQEPAQTRNPSSLESKKIASFLKAKPISFSKTKKLLESLNKQFGPPQHQEFALENFSNFDQKKKPVYILFYEGFELRVDSIDPMKDQYAVKSLIVHDNIFPLAYGIKIGTKKEDLIKLFGEALTRSNEEELSYCDQIKEQRCVSFHLQEEKVARIIWNEI